ncbi:MAG: hypothetical protein HYX55_06120 [Chloroflexi bacterium]|nr:hypothetical protein [Chloroflexota bacterium]
MRSCEADTNTPVLPAAQWAARVLAEERITTDALVARLDAPTSWAAAAAALVGELGFRLIGDGSTGSSEGHLIVGLRDKPTLRHFDPEFVSFYGPDAHGAALVTLGRLPPGTNATRDAAWGHVHVVDRIPVENRFLTFGGTMRMAGLEGGLTVAHLRSPVPIVRWGGHSQGTDSLAGAIGAFFGRLIVPVDFTPGAATRIDAVAPQVLFTAFLRDAVNRRHVAAEHGVDASELDRWLAAAWARAREDEPTRAAAESLLAELRL